MKRPSGPGLRMLTMAIASLAVVAGSLVIAPSTAGACSCAEPTVADAISWGDEVFVGSLVQRGDRVPVPGNEFNDTPYDFAVDLWLTGDETIDAITVWSADNGAACGFETPAGVKVAVAVGLQDDRYSGGLCSTFSATDALRQASELGRSARQPSTARADDSTSAGTETAADANEDDDDDDPIDLSSPWVQVTGLLATGTAVVALGALWWRRRELGEALSPGAEAGETDDGIDTVDE